MLHMNCWHFGDHLNISNAKNKLHKSIHSVFAVTCMFFTNFRKNTYSSINLDALDVDLQNNVHKNKPMC